MTSYSKGRRFEYKIKRGLEKSGCIVFRSAKSGGLFDLIALEPEAHKVLFIQCKDDKSYLHESRRIDAINKVRWIVRPEFYPDSFEFCFVYNNHGKEEWIEI